MYYYYSYSLKSHTFGCCYYYTILITINAIIDYDYFHWIKKMNPSIYIVIKSCKAIIRKNFPAWQVLPSDFQVCKLKRCNILPSRYKSVSETSRLFGGFLLEVVVTLTVVSPSFMTRELRALLLSLAEVIQSSRISLQGPIDFVFGKIVLPTNIVSFHDVSRAEIPFTQLFHTCYLVLQWLWNVQINIYQISFKSVQKIFH